METLMTEKKEDVSSHEIFNMKQPEGTTPKPAPKDMETTLSDIRTNFATARTTWKDRVVGMASSINDITTLSTLQVQLYSYRQICLEEKHMVMTFLAKLDKEYKRFTGRKWEALMNDNNRKLKMGETSIMAEADLAAEKERIELFSDQVEYFSETIKTIDHIIYGVRSRLEMEQYKRQQ